MTMTIRAATEADAEAICVITFTGAGGRTPTEAADLPLQGISADSPRTDAIAIIVGQSRVDHVTHEVTHPVAITIEHAAEGAERASSIRAADGSTMKVELRSPMGPGRGDGRAAR